MPHFLLSPQGVEDFLIDLYAQSDDIIKVESKKINTDFRGYVINEFDLTGKQISYLGNMNNDLIYNCGIQCALCFQQRLPIRLVYPTPPDPGYVKWVRMINDISMDTSYYGQLLVQGSLTIEIYYLD